MIDVKILLNLQRETIIKWHSQVVVAQEMLPWKFIEENNMWNFLLWHEEDIARITEIDPMRIVEAKRNIDKYNQSRNNSMEKIDEWILHNLTLRNITPTKDIHSETPGMMIDRLSILELKRYHMIEETVRIDASEDHKNKCNEKVSVLNEQIRDLSSCLSKVLSMLESGKLMFKVYRQLKMYNDPNLNPQLYENFRINV
jgi:hypothetical protein